MEVTSLVARRHPCGSVRVGNGVWETAVQTGHLIEGLGINDKYLQRQGGRIPPALDECLHRPPSGESRPMFNSPGDSPEHPHNQNDLSRYG